MLTGLIEESCASASASLRSPCRLPDGCDCLGAVWIGPRWRGDCGARCFAPSPCRVAAVCSGVWSPSPSRDRHRCWPPQRSRMGGCASTPTRDEYCDPGDLPRAAGKRISRRPHTRPAPSPDLRAQPGGRGRPGSPEAGLDVRARIAARVERLRSADGDRPTDDPESAEAARKPAGAQRPPRRRRAGSSRRTSRSSRSGPRPGGGSSVGTFQTAHLDLEDAIWADDLSSEPVRRTRSFSLLVHSPIRDWRVLVSCRRTRATAAAATNTVRLDTALHTVRSPAALRAPRRERGDLRRNRRILTWTIAHRRYRMIPPQAELGEVCAWSR